MQAAELRDQFFARPQHEVVRIGQDDLGAGGFHLLRCQTLDGSAGTDRHKGGRIKIAVWRFNTTEPRL